MREFRFINKQSLKEFKALPQPIRRQFGNDLNAILPKQFSVFKR
ncbi:MAG: hypothetical protein ACI9FJ_002638 [Alteromonadaceae bacterium]|jgi:hypothetical protein